MFRLSEELKRIIESNLVGNLKECEDKSEGQ